MGFWERIKEKSSSTFFKLTIAFICFGMLPLLLIGFLFIVRYFGSVEQAVENNYSLLSYYISKNVEDLFESVDTAMGYAYDYSNEEYAYLYELLKDDALPEADKEKYINKMLNLMLMQSEKISSIFFVMPDNTIYRAFYEQGKILRSDLEFDVKELFPSKDTYRNLKFAGTVNENRYYVNSSGYIFSLVRNYMDAGSVESVHSEVLATMYANVKVDQIEKVTKEIEVGDSGEIYIFNKSDNSYIYHPDIEYYNRSLELSEEYSDKIQGEQGSEKIGTDWIFYDRVGDTDSYVIVKLNKTEILGSYFRNRSVMLLVLAFTVFVLLVLYFIFSGKMSEQARSLKKAMQKVQTGDFSVRVDVKNNDEMGYLSDGFNKMVQDLQFYIEQVYEARLYQKEAELKALKMQIQPHYLYNTLDIIRMTALKNKDNQTAVLIESLSKQLRYVISQENEIVPLYKELDSIKEYFVIAKTRYENRFSINISVSDKDRNLQVMKLILQPAVENAIKHGLADKDGTGAVNIIVERKEEYLEIVVMDNGTGIEEDKIEQIRRILDGEKMLDEHMDLVGVGLKNVYDRIQKRCGEAYGFKIASYKGMGTIMTYKLPIWEGGSNVESSID